MKKMLQTKKREKKEEENLSLAHSRLFFSWAYCWPNFKLEANVQRPKLI